MTTRPLAVLDTNVVILLATEKQDDSPEEIETDRRRACIKLTIRDLQPKVRFAVPAAVVAELGDESNDAGDTLAEMAAEVGRFRILPLTREGGEIAARMAAVALATRAPNDRRGAVKFDTLIAATAHVHGALYLVTDNARDLAKPLTAVRSSVTVIVATEPRGQLSFEHVKPKR